MSALFDHGTVVSVVTPRDRTLMRVRAAGVAVALAVVGTWLGGPVRRGQR